MTQQLFQVTVEIEPERVTNGSESHTPGEIRTQYSSWLTDPTERLLTFRGATFTAQLARNPTPKVRVALAYNPEPHPLIAGAWLHECRPMTTHWLPDHLAQTNIEQLHGFQVTYRTPSTKSTPAEYAQSMLKNDVRDNFQYQIEKTSVDDEHTTLEVWIPESDTGNLSRPERLFPTADNYESLGTREV